MQDGRLAEEIALKEDVSELYRLTKFLLGFNFLCEQTNVLWQNFAQLLALFRICCDAEIDLNDVCHLD